MGTPSMIALCSLPVPVILYVLDYHLWLESGSGNANYIFFQCLAYQVFVAVIFLDYLNASLQRDKALRMTEKIVQQEGKE
jgi:phosphatidylinositol glycan class U